MKKSMKKILCVALCIAFLPLLLTACGNEEETPSGPAIRVAALKGPTGMAFAHMMKTNTGNYEFTLAGAPDELTGQIVSGNIDIAAVPTNLACVLYNKTKGGVKALSVITGGMLYVLERGDTIQSVTDLNGKSILCAGMGAAPEYVFNFILNQNGVQANVTYSADQTEVVSLAVAGKYDVVLLPEPHVTTLLTKAPDFRVALSLTDAFADAAAAAGYENAGLHMSTVIVRTAFLDEHPDLVKQFMADCEASVQFALDDPESAAKEIAEAGIIASAEVAEKALPSCALTFIAGDDMKNRLSPMLQVLHSANPASVGGALPADDFWYTGK